MEFPAITCDGKKLPELYHFGYSGTHFQIILSCKGWQDFVAMVGEGTHYAEVQGSSFVPPSVCGKNFGFLECARTLQLDDESVCIEIPVVSDVAANMRTYAETLEFILDILFVLLAESEDRKEIAETGYSQLFVLGTYVLEAGKIHGAPLALSVSNIARKYLENLGEGVRFLVAIQAMSQHAHGFWKDTDISYSSNFNVQVRTRGVLGMFTSGDCACLGTAPENFSDQEGCYLTSHNVDTVFQQLNLLIGIAYVWQLVRNGVHTQQHV